jgi:hypothetical protein
VIATTHFAAHHFAMFLATCYFPIDRKNPVKRMALSLYTMETIVAEKTEMLGFVVGWCSSIVAEFAVDSADRIAVDFALEQIL